MEYKYSGSLAQLRRSRLEFWVAEMAEILQGKVPGKRKLHKGGGPRSPRGASLQVSG